MSLMDRFNVLSQSAKDKGLSKDILAKAFAGSSMDGFDNGSEITDVICWDEGPQSAIVFLNEDWNVLDFSWVDEDANPDWEWKSNPELAGFFASCISYAKENHLSLHGFGCADAEDEDAIHEAPVNLMEEARQALEDSGRSVDDVAYVKVVRRNAGGYACIPFEHFAEIASSVEYECIADGPAIHSGLCIVLKDGSFFDRMWSDGSEWFRFHEAPEKSPKMAYPTRDEVCILYSDALD